MSIDLASLVTSFLGPLLGAAAAWGAIRSDIRHTRETALNAQRTADKAHARIDDILHDTGSHHPYREHR